MNAVLWRRCVISILCIYDFVSFLVSVSDKIALLIGNKDYENNLGKLYHPTNDVSDLAGLLTSIGFKVSKDFGIFKDFVLGEKFSISYYWATFWNVKWSRPEYAKMSLHNSAFTRDNVNNVNCFEPQP